MSKKEKQPEEVIPEEQTVETAAPETGEEASNPLLEELEALKQERAEQLLGSFMEEMKALGFEKKDILSMVSGYL